MQRQGHTSMNTKHRRKKIGSTLRTQELVEYEQIICLLSSPLLSSPLLSSPLLSCEFCWKLNWVLFIFWQQKKEDGEADDEDEDELDEKTLVSQWMLFIWLFLLIATVLILHNCTYQTCSVTACVLDVTFCRLKMREQGKHWMHYC